VIIEVEIFGPDELTAFVGAKKATYRQWRNRGVLPEHDLELSGVPVYLRSTAEEWAHRTGRLPRDSQRGDDQPEQETSPHDLPPE
jgi:hypothetical protein